MAREPCAGVWAPTWLSYFTMAMSAILLLVTVTGNFLVCLAVVKDPHRKLRTPFMFILFNLAVTDLIVGCVTLPTSVVTHSLEAAKTKKNFHVLIVHMTYFISCIASILNLTALCVDRFCAVTWPLSYRFWLNFKICVAISVSVWTLAVGISMFYWLVGYTNLLFIYAHTAIVVALIIAAVTCYVSIKLGAVAKQRHQSLVRSTNTTEQDLLQPFIGPRSAFKTKAEQNLTRLLLAILVTFILSYTPAIVMMYILKWCPQCNCNFRHVLRDLTFLCIVSSSAANPFVCAIRLKSFRQALGSIFVVNKCLRFRNAASPFSESKRKSSLTSDVVNEPMSETSQRCDADEVGDSAVVENVNIG